MHVEFTFSHLKVNLSLATRIYLTCLKCYNPVKKIGKPLTRIMKF